MSSKPTIVRCFTWRRRAAALLPVVIVSLLSCAPPDDSSTTAQDADAGSSEWMVGYIHELRLNATEDADWGEAQVTTVVTPFYCDPTDASCVATGFTIRYPRTLGEAFRAGDDLLVNHSGDTLNGPLLPESGDCWAIPFLAVPLSDPFVEVPRAISLSVTAVDLDDTYNARAVWLAVSVVGAALGGAGAAYAEAGVVLTAAVLEGGAGGSAAAVVAGISGLDADYIGTFLKDRNAWANIVTAAETSDDLDGDGDHLRVGYAYHQTTVPCNATAQVRIDQMRIPGNDESGDAEIYAYVKVWTPKPYYSNGPEPTLVRCPASGYKPTVTWSDVVCDTGSNIVYDGPLGAFLALEINWWDDDDAGSFQEDLDDDLGGNLSGLWLTEDLIRPIGAVGSVPLTLENITRENEGNTGHVSFTITVSNSSGTSYQYAGIPERVCVNDSAEYCIRARNLCPEEFLSVSSAFSADGQLIRFGSVDIPPNGTEDLCLSHVFLSEGEHTVEFGNLGAERVIVDAGGLDVNLPGTLSPIDCRSGLDSEAVFFVELPAGERVVEYEGLSFSVISRSATAASIVGIHKADVLGGSTGVSALALTGADDATDSMEIRFPPGGASEAYFQLFGGNADPDTSIDTMYSIDAITADGEEIADNKAVVSFVDGPWYGVRSCGAPFAAVRIKFWDTVPGAVGSSLHTGPWALNGVKYCAATGP